MPPSSPLATPSSSSSPASNGHARPRPQTDVSLRDQVAILHAAGLGPVLITEELHRSPGAVLREIQTLSATSCEAAQLQPVPAATNRSSSHRPPAPARTTRQTPVTGAAFDAFSRQALELRATGLSIPRIAERLHCTIHQVSWAFRVARTPSLRVGKRPTADASSFPLARAGAFVVFERRVRALRAQGLTLRQIAQRESCGRTKIHRALTHLPPASGPLPTHSQLTPPSPDAIVDLRAQGLSIRQIATRLGCSTFPVERTLTERKTWDTPHKREHETSLVALARTILPVPPSGVAIALTADQLAWHLDALDGVVTRLIAIERAPDVFTRMTATLTRTFRLPLSVHLGDFWAIARQLPDPIAFLDYDGMGALPADLKASLVALAPRFTSPCVIRLSCSMAHANSLQQLPQATQALGGVPGFQVTRLDVYSIPSSPGHMAMTTILAVLTKGAFHAPALSPSR